MRRTFNTITTAILAAAILVSAYFMYNFEPDRNIKGFKTFYREESYAITLGKAIDDIDSLEIGDKVLLYQDEQSMHGKLVKKDEFTIDDNGVLMSIVDEDAIIYKDLITINAVTTGYVVIAIIIADLIYAKRARSRIVGIENE